MHSDDTIILSKIEMIKMLVFTMGIGLIDGKAFVEAFTKLTDIATIDGFEDFNKFCKFIGILVKYQIKLYDSKHFLVDANALDALMDL